MNLIVGHMLGDYLFQNAYLAFNKTKRTLPCLIHCTLYTLCIMLVTSWLDWRLVVVFITHFIIDRFRLIKYWRKLIEGNAYNEKTDIPWMYISDNTIHLSILWLLQK